jgi:hypothetical protein
MREECLRLQGGRRTCSVPGRRWLFSVDIEGEEAIEQGRLATETPLGKERAKRLLRAMFEEAKPKQRPQHTCFHRVRSGIPGRLQDIRYRNGTEPGEFLRCLPVLRGYRKRPKQGADIALGPGIVNPPAEVAEIGMPERNVKENRLESVRNSLANSAT